MAVNYSKHDKKHEHSQKSKELITKIYLCIPIRSFAPEYLNVGCIQNAYIHIFPGVKSIAFSRNILCVFQSLELISRALEKGYSWRSLRNRSYAKCCEVLIEQPHAGNTCHLCTVAAVAAKELPRGMQVAGMQLQKFKLLLEQPPPSGTYISHNKDFLV